MKTWDFFDTLLGRACGEPWRVFELIGGNDFKKIRQQSEQISNKTFDGIYDSMKSLTGWSTGVIADLKNQEFDWERRLAFPIVENISKVSSEDMVITDTYFDERQIRLLGERVGLPAVNIHASYGDKWSGRIWGHFAKNGTEIETHTGDNKRSDFDMAKKYGFNAVWYTGGEYSQQEKEIHQEGHWDVAGLMRCVRLQNPFEHGSPHWQAYHIQSSVNVPFLLLASVQLKKYMKENKFEHVFFVSRDSILLKKIFSKLFPNISSDIFYSSRQTFKKPSKSFLEYCKLCCSKENALFVDLQGTGKTSVDFQNKASIKMNYLFCAQ
jgi:predicted HAD superfamily hydrolase